MKKTVINNEIVSIVNTVFELVSDFQFEEAYIFLLNHTDNKKIDPLIKEWIKALCEFFIYNKKDDAVNILEKAKPEKINSSLDLRIYSVLVHFYHSIRDKNNFDNIVFYLKNYFEHNECKYTTLKIKTLYNIANGYFVFYDFDNAIKYAGYCIDESTLNQKILNVYTMSLIIRIKSFYKKRDLINLKSELNMFNDYKYLIGNIEQNNNISKELEEINKIEKTILNSQGGVFSEKINII